MRYRRDIGSNLSDGEFAFVEALGLLDPMVEMRVANSAIPEK